MSTNIQAMVGQDWDIHTASEERLMELCGLAWEKDDCILGGREGGDRVVKLSGNIAVKYGYGVTASEARTQEFAHRYIDPSIVHVPRVFRFFQGQTDPTEPFPKGYLFMEYVPGQSLQGVELKDNVDIVPRVAGILKRLGDIQDGQVPGPIGTGEPQGYIWGDDGARTTFNSMADMEDWLNKLLLMHNKSIDLRSCPLVLCHMDLCRRNMILEEDDTICLLGWGFAGLYPRFFEIASLSCMNPYDEPYEKPLLEATKSLFDLTEEESRNMSLLKLARALNLRYSFNDVSEFGLPAGFYSLLPLPLLPDQPPSPS